MSTVEEKRVGRPARLTREMVLRAGLALADREGADSLTMRRLAAELDCGVMTLYGYVRDRDDLVGGVVGLLTAEVESGVEPGGSWPDVARQGANAYRAMARRHPGAFPLLALSGAAQAVVEPYLERIVAAYVRAGLGEREARELLGVVDSFCSGFLLMELDEEAATAQAAARRCADGAERTDAEQPESWSYLNEESYARGVELIIAGARSVLVPRDG
jgi:AcrR family transcriptional regulator